MALHLITYLIPATFTTRLPDGGLYFWHKQQRLTWNLKVLGKIGEKPILQA